MHLINKNCRGPNLQFNDFAYSSTCIIFFCAFEDCFYSLLFLLALKRVNFRAICLLSSFVC